MDKKDIYEHLAKIYLDASLKKKNKTLPASKLFKNLFFVCVAALAVTIGFFIYYRVTRPFNSEVSLVLLPDSAKINFHFDPARKETYSLDLRGLNLSRYKTLGFSARKINYENTVALRVEFVNAFKETSEIYLKDISQSWHEFKINFSKFKHITDWTEMTKLIFTIEEWNTREKKGIVYIDNVRLLTH